MTFQHLLKDDFIFNYVSEFMEFNNIKLSIINVGGKYYFNQYDNMFLIKDDIFKTKRGKNKLFRDELKHIEYAERKSKVEENKAIKENRKLRAEKNAIKLKEKKQPKKIIEESESDSESEEEIIIKKKTKAKPKPKKKVIVEESSDSEYEYALEEVDSQPVNSGINSYYSMFRR